MGRNVHWVEELSRNNEKTKNARTAARLRK